MPKAMVIQLVNEAFDDARRERACFVSIGVFPVRSTIGYYAMVGIFLKSFDVPTPDGSTPLK